MSTTARSTATSSASVASSARSIPSSTRSRRSTARGIGSRRSDDSELRLRWSRNVSLTRRILAVNIFALAFLAGGFFYLDSYRVRIVDQRTAQARREARLVAEALAGVQPNARPELARKLARDTGARIRVFDPLGATILDSQRLGVNNLVLLDPAMEGRSEAFGRFLDAAMERIAGGSPLPAYADPARTTNWPDVAAVRRSAAAAATAWAAPDRTPVITAAAPLAGGTVLMTATSAPDIVWTVRAERLRLSIVLLITALVSVLLSLFLARTIVLPLRRLARAAVRVRLGRAREVVVPRLPERRDEIGSLARALSDMSLALRARIDATEAFAADVTHELKNPLASLRSAVEGLATVRDRALQDRLFAIVREDVHRLDRLITDISEASRLDAQLARAKFELVDVDKMLAEILRQRAERGVERGVRIRYDHRPTVPTFVSAEGGRLERVFENLIDNALSFSSDDGLVSVATRAEGRHLEIRIEDDGPGVPENEREAIFRRFQSVRPTGEAFGQHSGLGLAIARTIVEGHGGRIEVEEREDRLSGARFVVRLPLASR